MFGIKIDSHKEQTRFENIEGMPLPEEVILYTSQHIGAPSEVIVRKGQEVERGEEVARAAGHCSAALHTPVSGKVTDISPVDRPGGRSAEAVTVKNSGKNEIRVMPPLDSITPQAIRERVKEAGIVGLGGAGFPTHVKLDPPKNIHTAIMNGCECEPYLTADERVMEEEAAKVIEGLMLIRTAVGAEKAVIGIEDDKPGAAREMRRLGAGKRGLELAILPKVYPQGYEKLLITAVTGREVPSGGLPHDAGVSVHNASTCLAVYEAVREGKPLIELVLTVSGEKIERGVNVRVSVGTPVSEVLKHCRINPAGRYALLMGGPMMGCPLDNPSAGVLKATSGILLFEEPRVETYPCLRCGRCVERCPMGLMPQELNKYFEGEDYARMTDAGLSDCMECGCCAYLCPSGIPLTGNFKAAKGAVS